MKKMKKILAMLLALTMVLGMSLTSMAEETTQTNSKPHSGNTAKITVHGIEAGATVKAYKIVKADYNDEGLVGYSKVDTTDDFDIENPTSEEIVTLAVKYRGNASGQELSPENTDYVLTTNAGTYLILVEGTPSAKIYNPMIVSLAYKTLEDDENSSGSSNVLKPGEVNAGTNWTFPGVDLYAKSSEIKITKKITSADKASDAGLAGDVAYGNTVTYESTTYIPDYSAEYGNNVVFTITDKMENGLNLNTSSVKVYVDEVETADTVGGVKVYDLTPDTHEFIINFDPAWVIANGGKAIRITYSAEVNTAATTNFDSNDNKIKLNYTYKPNQAHDTEFIITRDYTFEINGEIIKVDENENPLSGATFELKNTATNEVYTAESVNGILNFKGLDAGTYTLVEKVAPKGYSINETVYTVTVMAEYTTDKDLLKSYTISVDDGNPATEVKTSIHTAEYNEDGTYEVSHANNPEKIKNTKLVSLPSTGGIGTTIFTVAGCGIMIAAAFFFFASRKRENN